MSATRQVASHWVVRTLQAAMMTQILLGLARFFAPFSRLESARVGLAHPPSPRRWDRRGRDDRVATASRRRADGVTADRAFAPLAPLALGLAMAFGLRLGAGLAPLHMVVGLTALGVVDRALKHLLAEPTPAHPRTS